MKKIIMLLNVILFCALLTFFYKNVYIKDFYIKGLNEAQYDILFNECKKSGETSFQCARHLCEQRLYRLKNVLEVTPLEVHSYSSKVDFFSLLMEVKQKKKLSHYLCEINNNQVIELEEINKADFIARNYSYLHGGFTLMQKKCKKNENLGFICAQFLCGKVISNYKEAENADNIYAKKITSNNAGNQRISLIMAIKKSKDSLFYSCDVNNNTVINIEKLRESK